MFDRAPYGPKGTRHRYVLTEKGLELGTTVIALSRWGDRHYPNAAGPPRDFQHVDCGRRIMPELICETHGQSVDAGDVVIVPRPDPAHVG